MVMSVALWPVFEDGHKHGLCDEGIPCAGGEDPEYLAYCLEAFRQTLQQAATRKTRFNFTIA
jgi:hypothetical protein